MPNHVRLVYICYVCYITKCIRWKIYWYSNIVAIIVVIIIITIIITWRVRSCSRLLRFSFSIFTFRPPPMHVAICLWMCLVAVPKIWSLHWNPCFRGTRNITVGLRWTFWTYDVLKCSDISNYCYFYCYGTPTGLGSISCLFKIQVDEDTKYAECL